MTPAQLNQVIKTQRVRLFDVFFFGPLITVGGLALVRKGHPFMGLALSALGFTTVLYNYRNWGVVEEARRRNT